MLPRSLRKLSFVLPLACACHSWSPVPLAPKALGELPVHSRVVPKRSAPVQLYKAHATADSIVGWRGSDGLFAVPRDSVARVEERHFAPVRTIGLVAGVGVAIVAALGVAFLSSGDLQFHPSGP